MKFRLAFAPVVAAAVLTAGVPAFPASAEATTSAGTIPQLTIGFTTPPSSLDPAKNGGPYDQLSLETLLKLGPQGQLEPELATSWAQTGPVTYVYHLRHGVTFWDGSELTAADVAYSLNYLRAPGSLAAYTYTSVKSIVATSPYTVVITLTHPDASWQYTPADNGQIFEKKFAEAHKGTFGDPSVLIMGTGPWEMDNYDPTKGAELSANPHWWGGQVPIAHISYKFFSDETSVALAMRAGEIDLYPWIANPPSFASTSGIKPFSATSCGSGIFSMNTQVAPWNDVHVRRAVAYALNRTDIIAANGGYATPNYTLIPPQQLETIASQSQVNALLKSIPLYAYNLAKAKAEMAESSYPHGFSTTLVEYVYGAEVNISQVIAAELAKIGINAHIKVLPTFEAWETVATGPAAQRPTNFFTSGCQDPDPSWYTFILGSKNTAVGENNFADYDPPAVDKLIAAGVATTNAAQRFAIYSSLLRTLASDVPYVPLYLTGAAVGVSRNFTIPDYSSYFTEDVYALLVKPTT